VLSERIWIERSDFAEEPPKGYQRLFVGNKVRLKYGYVIECTGCVKNADGIITEVLATLVPDTKSGTPGASAIKVKGVITWVSQVDGKAAEIRVYDRLFTEPHPDAGGRDFLTVLNPDSLKIEQGYVEPSLALSQPEQHFQFERHGYFCSDRVEHGQNNKLVFNRTTELRDNWGK
jgi:glutaminyl-tRNA synthetase